MITRSFKTEAVKQNPHGVDVRKLYDDPHHISNESQENARILVIKAPRPEVKSILT